MLKDNEALGEVLALRTHRPFLLRFGPARVARAPGFAQSLIDDAQLDPAAVVAKLRSHPNGLTDSEAERRLAETGPNQVAHERVPGWAVQLLACFANPFILVLLALAAVSFLTDDDKATIVLTTMVAISVALRFWQERRSTKAAEALRAMVTMTVAVRRRADVGSKPSIVREMPVEEIVPGDVVLLAAGDMVPADVRLLDSRDLFVSQSVLTGESIPVEKYDTLGAVAQKSAGAATATADRPDLLETANVCLMGSNVVSGSATAIVVATGNRTYFGSLAKSIVGTRAQTAFDRGVNSVSWVLIRFMAVMAPVVLLLNGFTKGDWTEAAFFALSVAVGLTPEMLPMIVSTNLARGAVQMSRHKVIVKRLNAIQNFGAMDVLCTDKTGTLTQDRVMLVRHLDVCGGEAAKVLELAWLNSRHQTGLRNLMDKAILQRATELDAFRAPNRYGKVDELPFDFVRRRMSVIVEDGTDAHLLVCKGAVEEVLGICDAVRMPDGSRVTMAGEHARLTALAASMNDEGFRVLAVATRSFPDSRAQYRNEDESALTLEGFLAFLDPPKDSAGAAIAALARHGTTVKILTGDNALVTRKICREVGLDPGVPVLGRDVEALDDAALRKLAQRTTVFAKMSPLQKARVIRALQEDGHTVGFLGDGINDAPALRDADVGISVDSAADIAKESSDIILLEKNLLVLEQGVLLGRVTFGNIIKYIKMTASSNFGNVFSVLAASVFLPFLPMLPLHLLIQNLCYDVSQLSIPWDRMDEEYVERPRKWMAGDIARFMACIGPISSIFDVATFCLMWFWFGATTPAEQSLFQSAWFVEGLLSQTLIVHMIRTRKVPFFQSTASLPVLLLTGTIMAIGIAIPFSPLGTQIGLQPLPLAYFPWLAAILVAYCVLTQVVKRWYVGRFGQWL